MEPGFRKGRTSLATNVFCAQAIDTYMPSPLALTLYSRAGMQQKVPENVNFSLFGLMEGKRFSEKTMEHADANESEDNEGDSESSDACLPQKYHKCDPPRSPCPSCDPCAPKCNLCVNAGHRQQWTDTKSLPVIQRTQQRFKHHCTKAGHGRKTNKDTSLFLRNCENNLGYELQRNGCGHFDDAFAIQSRGRNMCKLVLGLKSEYKATLLNSFQEK